MIELDIEKKYYVLRMLNKYKGIRITARRLANSYEAMTKNKIARAAFARYLDELRNKGIVRSIGQNTEMEMIYRLND